MREDKIKFWDWPLFSIPDYDLKNRNLRNEIKYNKQGPSIVSDK